MTEVTAVAVDRLHHWRGLVDRRHVFIRHLEGAAQSEDAVHTRDVVLGDAGWRKHRAYRVLLKGMGYSRCYFLQNIKKKNRETETLYLFFSLKVHASHTYRTLDFLETEAGLDTSRDEWDL